MITDYLPFNKSQSNQLITNFLKNKNNVKINNNIQTAGFFFDTKKIFNFKFKKNKNSVWENSKLFEVCSDFKVVDLLCLLVLKISKMSKRLKISNCSNCC